jgi:hypothetical protein
MDDEPKEQPPAFSDEEEEDNNNNDVNNVNNQNEQTKQSFDDFEFGEFSSSQQYRNFTMDYDLDSKIVYINPSKEVQAINSFVFTFTR